MLNPKPMPIMIPDVQLQTLNTLAIPARAACLARVDAVEKLAAVLSWLRQQRKLGVSQPLLVLGGGSNLVLSSSWPGLVLQMAIPGIEVVAENDEHVWLKVGAGESWHGLVEHCMKFHYWGLENLALIPGSVGAAPIQNIGAYGVELKDYFAELGAIEVESGLDVTFDKDACHFGYRDSVFKQALRDRYIITSVTFRLRKTPRVVCEYPALRDFFSERDIQHPSPQQVFKAVCAIRSSKLPSPGQLPNAGSFFKNPLVSAEQFESLQRQHEGLVGYSQADGQVKLAAGWLIDRAGWRGYRQGAVGVHEQQALVLVNPGQGTGRELLALAKLIQDDVKARYGVELEIEPRVY